MTFPPDMEDNAVNSPRPQKRRLWQADNTMLDIHTSQPARRNAFSAWWKDAWQSCITRRNTSKKPWTGCTTQIPRSLLSSRQDSFPAEILRNGFQKYSAHSTRFLRFPGYHSQTSTTTLICCRILLLKILS